MSDRFVAGWKVAPEKLLTVSGSLSVRARDVLASKANARCKKDVLMTLGSGDAARGKSAVDGAISEILAGELIRDHAYHYARVLELLLNDVALPLSRLPNDEIRLEWTYHANNSSHGRWNPLLAACGLPKLAKVWASANVAFPWPSRGPKVEFPQWTMIDAKLLPAIAKELSGLDKERVDALPDRAFLRDTANESREELWAGLQRLYKWIDIARTAEKKEGTAWAKSGNALFLKMDGDR